MFKIGIWSPLPPPSGPLSRGEIHLWRISLAPSGPLSLEPLAADEKARANRFRREPDRARFVAARLSLRGILALYSDCDPGEIRFRYNHHGKPALRGPGTGLEFNLSHAGDRALLAVSRSTPLGIDLERVSERVDQTAIGGRVFGPEFANRLEAMPAEERCRRFIEAWTALEARTKALGSGVFARGADWERLPVRHFEPDDGWLAALASPLPLPPPERWACFEWPAGEVS